MMMKRSIPGINAADANQLLDLVIAKSRAAYRKSWLIGIISLAIAASWLIYTEYRVSQNYRLVQQLQAQSKDLSNQIRSKEIYLEKMNAIAPYALTAFGYKGGSPSNVLDEALNANQVFNELKGRGTTVRSRLRVEYYAKDRDTDPARIASILKELGFEVTVRKPNVTVLSTDTVWFGRSVPIDQAKLVAVTLMRAGVRVRHIWKFRKQSSNAEGTLIQLGATTAPDNGTFLKPQVVLETKDLS
jgi:hypothetical protein